MEVDWSTIDAIAKTKAIDLWLLFPLGQAVNRMLTRNGPPDALWSDRLTKFFGTPDWKDAFYQPTLQTSFFDQDERLEKKANFEQIGAYFLQRLADVFAGVAKNPLYLKNSKNVPIYLLCFAVANERGAPPALRIASHILGKQRA